MEEIKTDLKRAIYSLPFLLASIAMVLAIAIGAGAKMVFPKEIGLGLNFNYHWDLIFQGLSSNIVLMIVPIICTLPYTSAFLDEYKSGFLKPYLIKCDKSAYIRGKVLTGGISGGLALALGILLSYFLASLIYKPLQIADPQAISPINILLKKTLVFFLCGFLWASLGSLLANITLSKYMAYGAPLVIYYVLVILSERYFHSVYVINPEEWLAPENYWPGGDWGIMLLIILLSLIIMMVNDVVIEGRIEG
ncbi:MAG: hypothetical protein GX352_07190 [Clostridiales bacterium]|nr:hypothetical protein [Clostridiales bacterium]